MPPGSPTSVWMPTTAASTSAVGLHRESLTLYRELGDKAGTALVLIDLGLALHRLDDHRGAAALFEESLALNRALDNRDGIAWCLARHLPHLSEYQPG